MSHFTVVVIGTKPDNLDAVMEPFSETTEDRKYVVFRDDEDEYRKKYEEESLEMVRLADGTLKYRWDDCFKRGPVIGGSTHYPADSQMVQVPHRDRYATFEEFMLDYCGYKGRDEEMGRYGHFRNPNGHWDWYVIGGRWSGFFRVKPGAVGELGRPGAFDNEAPAGTADVIAIGDWDLARQRDEAAAKAAERYDRFLTLLGEQAMPPSWDSVRSAHGDDIDAARKAFWGHPSIAHLKSVDTEHEILGFDGDPGDEFNCSLAVYQMRARNRVGVPFAVVKDGNWYSRGRMHMFGISTGEMDIEKWCEFVAGLYDGLPPDTPLIAVDCHT